jgi:hypothetical protein
MALVIEPQPPCPAKTPLAYHRQGALEIDLQMKCRARAQTQRPIQNRFPLSTIAASPDTVSRIVARFSESRRGLADSDAGWLTGDCQPA